jgi:hypothetical protein
MKAAQRLAKRWDAPVPDMVFTAGREMGLRKRKSRQNGEPGRARRSRVFLRLLVVRFASLPLNVKKNLVVLV